MPRLAPERGTILAGLSAQRMVDLPVLTPREAIRREATVDVSLAVARLYEGRGFEPIWTERRAKALRSRLAEADLDGFDPADYAVQRGDLPDAAFDLALTEAALRYAHHAMS
ncbi:MAG: hypothetical protein AAGB11_17590, partial [Pseudomonadota bacterium]